MKECIVFDLDDTLLKDGVLINMDIPQLLRDLKENGYILVIASFNESAERYLKLNEIDHFFDLVVGFSDVDKIRHFTIIRDALQVGFSNMHFFDDLYTNINTIGQLGVNCYKVDPEVGVTYNMFE